MRSELCNFQHLWMELSHFRETGGWKVVIHSRGGIFPEIHISPGWKILGKTPVQTGLCLLSIHIFCDIFHNHGTLRNENLHNRKPCISPEIWFCSTWSNQLLFYSIGDGPSRASGFRPSAPGLPAEPRPVHRCLRPEQTRGDSLCPSLSFDYSHFVSLALSLIFPLQQRYM